MAASGDGGLETHPVDALSERTRQIHALVVSAVYSVKKRDRHRHNRINLSEIVSRSRGSLNPIDKIILKPNPLSGFVFKQKRTGLVFKNNSTRSGVVKRDEPSAFLADETADSILNTSAAYPAASLLAEKRDAHQAGGTDIPPRPVRPTSADLASARPDNLK